MIKITKNKLIRRFILISFDLLMLFASYIISLIILNYSSFNSLNNIFKRPNIFAYTLISIFIYFLSGQYKFLSEFFSRNDLYKLIIRNSLIIFLYSFLEKIIFSNDYEINLLFLIWIFTNILTLHNKNIY